MMDQRNYFRHHFAERHVVADKKYTLGNVEVDFLK